jgi:hypothetical protein
LRLAGNGIGARCYGGYRRIDGADTRIFKRDDHESPPDRMPFETQERDRSALRELSLAAADRLLQQASDDPCVCIDRSGLLKSMELISRASTLSGSAK